MEELIDEKGELDSLFSDTGASHTPNVVTFKSEEPTQPEPEPSGGKTKKKRKAREPRKPYQRKKKKEYDEMADFIVQDSPASLLAMASLSAHASAGPVGPENVGPVPAFVEREKQRKKKVEFLQHAVYIDMHQQGKGENDIKAEMKKIERLSDDDLEFEIKKASWTQSDHFTDKVAQVLRDGTGWLADRLLSGEGQISQEFEKDRALKAALQKQML